MTLFQDYPQINQFWIPKINTWIIATKIFPWFQVLNIAGFALTSGEIQLIVEKCTNLQELSINASYIDMKTGLKTLEYLIQNLTPNMFKLGLIRNRYIGK